MTSIRTIALKSLVSLMVSGLMAMSAARPANAAALEALSSADAKLYSSAFDAAERGDFDTADQSLAHVSDPCLVGRVEYVKLAGPAPRKSSFAELVGWLSAFKDLPGADRIYNLALKLKPSGAQIPAPVAALSVASATDSQGAPDQRTSPTARQAYYGGDVTRALGLASASGDLWIAGLSAYRLGRFPEAMDDFWSVARDNDAGDMLRAGGAFWAARAAGKAGLAERERDYLRAAATLPTTFYGMIAQRRLELIADPLGRLLDTPEAEPKLIRVNATGLDAPAVIRLVQTDPRARRAVALMQIGRAVDAGLELRTGMALAEDDTQRAAWTTLVLALNPNRRTDAALTDAPVSRRPLGAIYPTPPLAPAGGYTLDRALVYALAWQESRFDPLAVSPVGAIGLMQVMPSSAADIGADPVLRDDPTALFDPPTNLRLGQDYVTWLMRSAVGPDLLRVVAAYNAGPAALDRTQKAVGVDDTLLIVESMPALETRNYVRRVMAAYWSYRRQFGADSPTLDALASGATSVDAALDR
jgi:soluble lytic murein transglycosylase-like protein